MTISTQLKMITSVKNSEKPGNKINTYKFGGGGGEVVLMSSHFPMPIAEFTLQ